MHGFVTLYRLLHVELFLVFVISLCLVLLFDQAALLTSDARKKCIDPRAADYLSQWFNNARFVAVAGLRRMGQGEFAVTAVRGALSRYQGRM